MLVRSDPLPAGCEAIDPRLQTASATAFAPRLEREREAYDAPWTWLDWYGYWATHIELRDEKMALFADRVAAGTYEYTYTLRCTTPGAFKVMPATAYEMYFPDNFGRSAGGVFTVTDPQ